MNFNGKDESERSKIVIVSVEIPNHKSPKARRRSKAKSIEEWLIEIIESDKPKVPIGYFHFSFLDAGDHYKLVLAGLNVLRNRIDYEPSLQSLNLSKSQYGNLDEKQVKENVKAQLKTFTDTEKFNTSFFAQAESIGINSEQNTLEIIWSK